MDRTTITRLFPPPAETTPCFLCRADLITGTDTGGTPLPRVQPTALLLVVLEGAGTVQWGSNRAHTVSAGDLVYLPPLVTHTGAAKTAPWRCLCFHFTGPDAAACGTRMGFSAQRPIRRCGSAFPAVCAIAERLSAALAQDATHAPFLSAFRELAVLCRLVPLPELAAEAKAVIQANYASADFTLAQLCRHLSIDHGQLCHAFRQTYGLSMVNLLIRCRLDFAKQLLVTTTLPVQVVACSCGFRDKPHFMRSFKSAEGITPLAYRRAHRLPASPV